MLAAPPWVCLAQLFFQFAPAASEHCLKKDSFPTHCFILTGTHNSSNNNNNSNKSQNNEVLIYISLRRPHIGFQNLLDTLRRDVEMLFSRVNCCLLSHIFGFSALKQGIAKCLKPQIRTHLQTLKPSVNRG